MSWSFVWPTLGVDKIHCQTQVLHTCVITGTNHLLAYIKNIKLNLPPIYESKFKGRLQHVSYSLQSHWYASFLYSQYSSDNLHPEKYTHILVTTYNFCSYCNISAAQKIFYLKNFFLSTSISMKIFLDVGQKPLGLNPLRGKALWDKKKPT